MDQEEEDRFCAGINERGYYPGGSAARDYLGEDCWLEPDGTLVFRDRGERWDTGPDGTWARQDRDRPPFAYLRLLPPRQGLGVQVRFGPTQPGDLDGWQEYPRDPYITEFGVHYLDPDTPEGRFYASIPADIRSATKDIRFLAVTVMQLAIRHPRARQMLATDPLLVQLLAAGLEQRVVDWDQVDHLLGLKRPELLTASLGGEVQQTGESIRLLRRLRYRESGYLCLVSVQDTLNNPARVRALRHWLVIPQYALSYVDKVDAEEYRNLLRNATNEYYSEYPDPEADEFGVSYSWLHKQWDHTLRLAMDVHAEALVDSVRRYAHSLSKPTTLLALHDRLIERSESVAKKRLEAIVVSEEQQGPYPTPPAVLLSNEQLTPILDPRELYEEGVAMNHCVFSALRSRLREGDRWIFRYTGEERATVEVVKDENGYAVSQCALRSNNEPWPQTLAAVEAWVEKANQIESGQFAAQRTGSNIVESRRCDAPAKTGQKER